MLGNIAGDSVTHRNYLIKNGTLNKMYNYYQQVKDTMDLKSMRDFAWSVSNFVRGNPSPDYESVVQFFPMYIDQFQKSVQLG
jgi:hypothetical protein